MELRLEPNGDASATAAACAAAQRVGVTLARGDRTTPNAWWRAGLVEAIERYPSWPSPPQPYEAAPSPRSTRGATRA
jgi:hypothetical protein